MDEQSATTVVAILEFFNSLYEDHSFPTLDHPYLYTIESRMHAYGDGNRWALVAECAGYSNRAWGLQNDVRTLCGSASTPPDGDEWDFEDFFEIEEIVDVEDEFVDGEFRPVSNTVILKGQEITFRGSMKQDLSDYLRELSPDHKDVLLGDEGDVRQHVPQGLPKILTLEEWHHNQSFQEPPSSVETFRQLAQVLATGDPNYYAPTVAPNSHWSNWPDAGSL